MLTSQYFAGLSILTSKIDLQISDRYVQDFFFRKICKVQKAGLQNTERPIKGELGPLTSPALLGDVMSSIFIH